MQFVGFAAPTRTSVVQANMQGKIDAEALKTMWISYFELKEARVPALVIANEMANKDKPPDFVLKQYYATYVVLRRCAAMIERSV